ncbi:MAG: response regulator [Spirochaetes bacterium]|nr:response regulator [Spirochaetota bacterium]
MEEHLASYDTLDIIGCCHSGPEAVRMIEDESPDLIFLDVQMPSWSGFDMLKHLSHMPHIIFMTAHEKFAVKAFETGAVDYLLKPYSKNRLAKAVDRFHQTWQTASPPVDTYAQLLDMLKESRSRTEVSDHLLVETSNKVVRVQIDDILHIEAAGDYSKIHTTERTYLSTVGIGDLEQRLDGKRFMRVHRSAIVALGAVSELIADRNGGYEAYLENGISVRVSRSYGKKLRKLIL